MTIRTFKCEYLVCCAFAIIVNTCWQNCEIHIHCCSNFAIIANPQHTELRIFAICNALKYCEIQVCEYMLQLDYTVIEVRKCVSFCYLCSFNVLTPLTHANATYWHQFCFRICLWLSLFCHWLWGIHIFAILFKINA